MEYILKKSNSEDLAKNKIIDFEESKNDCTQFRFDDIVEDLGLEEKIEVQRIH